jgi:hypothetical protein
VAKDTQAEQVHKAAQQVVQAVAAHLLEVVMAQLPMLAATAAPGVQHQFQEVQFITQVVVVVVDHLQLQLTEPVDQAAKAAELQAAEPVTGQVLHLIPVVAVAEQKATTQEVLVVAELLY